MNNLIYFYQYLPQKINPTIFSFGFFRFDWYSVMYIVAFLIVYFLLRYRIQKKENKFEFSVEKLENFLLWVFLGLIIGARIGYVLFYDFSYFAQNPLAIISPFDQTTGDFVGIYGMSYHGGFLGVLLFSWIFAKKKKISFLQLANFVVPAIGAGYFFGRMGNFLNGELYGRVTEKFLGMYFSSDISGFLRHPSQLYEAFFEGIVLFLILWKLRNSEKFKNKMFTFYIIGYSFFRFLIEFFREPDSQIGFVFGFFTLGQILSFLMILLGMFLLFWDGRKSKKML